MTIRTAALAFAVVATTSSMAFAGPEPPTQEEMFDMVDVVADVETVSLSCAGEPIEDEFGTVTTDYIAEFTVLDVLKGEVDETIEYEVSKREYAPGNGPLGCSSPQYVLPQGWVGRVYLDRGSSGRYRITYSGGAVKDHEQSIEHEVPSCELTSADPDPNLGPMDSAADEQATAAGCSTGSGGASGWAPLLFLAAFALGRRRRDA